MPAARCGQTFSIERAAKNLRTTLNYLHVVLEPGRSPCDVAWFVRSDGQRITLHGSLDVDLWQFRELLDDADTAERGRLPPSSAPAAAGGNPTVAR